MTATLGCCDRLPNGIQHDDGDLPLGLLGVVGIGRPEFQSLVQSRARSAPLTVRALALTFLVPTWTSTSGWATRFLYQLGWSGAPPLDATTM